MKPTIFLHQLVHALSPVEKSGFETLLRQGRNGDNSLYFRLFQMLDRQAAYDEEAIRQSFAGTSFGKSLGFPKSHLYDRLLAFLQGRQAGMTAASSARLNLDNVELLSERGLPEQAVRLIEKGLRLAEELEDAIVVLQLLRLKRRQVMRLQLQALSAAIAEISAHEAYWETMLEMEQHATRLHDELYAASQEVRRKARAADDPHLQALWHALETLLARPGLGFHARVAAWRARAHYHHMREDFAAVHDAYQAEIALWEAQPLQIQHAQLRFVRLIGQWLTSKALLGDYAGLLAEVKRLRGRADLDQRGEAEVFQCTYTLELYYYLNAGRPLEALPLLDAVSQGLKQHDALLPPSAKLGFYYNLALVHWLGAQPSAALKWVRRIQQFEKGAVRKDIRDFAPLLEQVLHYELGNTGVLESWFRASKYRRKQAGAPTLEGILADLLQKLLGVSDFASQTQHFQDFAVALDAYAEQPGVSRLGIHELKAWTQRQRGVTEG
jgi:hypothetical protein